MFSLVLLYYYLFRFVLYLLFFFFKQKTAYEMRISYWSSDVCSSDLFGCDLAKHIVPVRCRGTTDDRGIGIEHVERHDIPEGRADIFTGACYPANCFQHGGDAHQSVTAFASRNRDSLFQAFAGTKVSASHQGAEHGDRRVGKRGFHLAQRSKQVDPPAEGDNL